MYLTLEQTKKHLNIEDDFTEDDAYITSLIQVAEDSVRVNLDVELCDIEVSVGVLPPAVTHAMLLMVANLYANREPVQYGVYTKLPLSYEYLIALYKNYNGLKYKSNNNVDYETVDDELLQAILQRLDELSWALENSEDYSEEISTLRNEVELRLRNYVTANWVTDNFQPIGDYLTEHQSLSDYYTKREIDNREFLTEHQSLSNYYTKGEIESKNYLTEHQSLERYALKSDLNNKADKDELFSGNYEDLINKPNLSKYALKTEIPADVLTVDEIANKADKSELFSKNYNDLTNKPDLSVYALKSEIQNIDGGFSGDYNDLTNKPNLSVYALKSEIPNDYLVESDIADKADRSELFSGSYNDLTNKPNLSEYALRSDIPTNSVQMVVTFEDNTTITYNLLTA